MRDSDPGVGGSRSLVLRMRVAASRDRLTRELAEGAKPGSSPERGLRAAQLTGDRERKQLARTLRRTISEAHQPQLTRSRVVIINRAQVLDAEDAINAMVARMGYPEPVRAEGMAIAERILTNADMSPLYNSAEAPLARCDPPPPIRCDLRSAGQPHRPQNGSDRLDSPPAIHPGAAARPCQHQLPARGSNRTSPQPHGSSRRSAHQPRSQQTPQQPRLNPL